MRCVNQLGRRAGEQPRPPANARRVCMIGWCFPCYKYIAQLSFPCHRNNNVGEQSPCHCRTLKEYQLRDEKDGQSSRTIQSTLSPWMVRRHGEELIIYLLSLSWTFSCTLTFNAWQDHGRVMPVSLGKGPVIHVQPRQSALSQLQQLLLACGPESSESARD